MSPDAHGYASPRSARDALWDSGYDETVEVNQRALIDKVLARYSGEFTVFRELLQNSDDAQSEAVEIRFETAGYNSAESQEVVTPRPSLQDLKMIRVSRWTFRNNGILFRDEDWSRLKKIAEGNPDEEKIGAFGVGFYSLFSVTDDPFVTSGDQWMAMYWKDKKDQLYARRGKLPGEEHSAWTSFEMPLREPAPIPTPFDLIRFLTSSITFMTSLRTISVFIDDKRLAKLDKSIDLPQELGVPKGFNKRSHFGTMTVNNVKSTPLQIRAEVMKWVYSSGSEKKPLILPVPVPQKAQGFFSSLFTTLSGVSTPLRLATPLPAEPPEEVDLLAVNSTSVSLAIFSADVSVKLDKRVSAELLRSTKKNAPSKLRYDLIYTGKGEYDTSVEEDKKYPTSTGSIFQGLRADIEGIGATRIFIGHATAQTTGIGGHMAARFIPTVERESIDFVDRNIAIWNKELLSVGAILARTAYEYELADIRSQWEKAKSSTSDPPPDIRSSLVHRALHALKFFTFHQSTPSPDVSQLLEEGFFSCSMGTEFPIISSRGVVSSANVRMPDHSLSGFVKTLPVVPEEVISAAPRMLATLQARRLIRNTKFDDVLDELRSRTLSQDEFVECLKWWITMKTEGVAHQLLPFENQLLDAAVLGIPGNGKQDEKLIQLSSIRTFLSRKTIIPLDGPLPDHVLPVSISNEFEPDKVHLAFCWTELTLVEWLSHICSLNDKSSVEFNINASPRWAERVLGVISRAWPSLPAAVKGDVANLLADKTCIPTSSGMKTPNEAYFPSVKMFPDLPIVTLPSGNVIRGGMEKFLQDLSVRKHVEMRVIFSRMIETNQWTIAELVKYLVSISSTLTREEVERLQQTAVFPQAPDLNNAHGNPSARYLAAQLYEPLNVFRQLKLPTLDWGTQVKWKSNSDEAKFLYHLGLKRYPPLPVLINLCADGDPEIRSIALHYLLQNLTNNYSQYNAAEFADVAYIPGLLNSKPCLGSPKEVFSGWQWAEFGFMVLQPDYLQEALKLQIEVHPSAEQLITYLSKTPPKDDVAAKKLFSVISSQISDFRPAQLYELARIPFVPVKTKMGKSGPPIDLLPPSQCYLGNNSNNAVHSNLFTFVDFGKAANSFLIACGARQEPGVDEIAKIWLANPRGFYELCEGPEKYLAELRNLAVNIQLIPSTTVLEMRQSPMFLGMQRKQKGATTEKDIDEEEWDITYDLKKAHQVVVVDDSNSYQMFGDSLFAAPQETILEGFYLTLGSCNLSALVREEYLCTAELPKSKIANETRQLVLERLPLFLHEHTHSKMRVSLSWLSSPGHFIVQTFGKLSLTKSLNVSGIAMSKRQDASAVVRRTGDGPICLGIAGNTQLDLYEVAVSLIRVLFDFPKANDALLLMTILSTDLRSLKRRGYNVNRILRQQQEYSKKAALPPAPPPNVPSPDHKNGAEPDPGSIRSPPPPPAKDKPNMGSPLSGGGNGLSGFMAKQKQKILSSSKDLAGVIKQKATSPHPPESSLIPHPGQPSASYPEYSNTSPESHTEPASTLRPGKSVPVTTPKNAISSNIDLAIKACQEESHDFIQDREHMQKVNESLNESYCDISGSNDVLARVGEMGSMKIYLSQDVARPTAATFISDNRDPLARFIHILTRLSEVYELPKSRIHIFYDVQGGLIAFNRGGSLFFNFRYYHSWHEGDVRKGQLKESYISWYMTMAHEIAHNLVKPHNSEHEFYFAQICEKYMLSLATLLSA